MDREKTIKGLETIKQFFGYGLPSTAEMFDSYYDILNDAIALLKKQDAVVRCKDCKYWSAERINDFNKCRRWINVGVKNFATMGDWFCADGERK